MNPQPEFDPTIRQSELPASDIANGYEAIPTEVNYDNDQAWVVRHRTKLALGGLVLAGGLSLTQFNQVADEVKDNAKWVVPAIATAEVLAWGGAGIMLASAGRKVGNPLTVKSRLNEVRAELNDSTLYRAGWGVGAIGAVGTAGVVSGATLAYLPTTSWPLAIGVSAASLGLSTIPFKPAKKNQENK